MSAAEHDVPELDADEVDIVAPTDPVEMDRFIGWRLRRIAAAKAQQARNTAVADAEAKRYHEWAAAENATIQRSIDWLEAQIHQVALAYDFAGKRSRKLAEGTFGFRTIPGRTIITDMDAAVEFARAHDITVKVSETVPTLAMREYVESTGETPDFVEIEAKRDAFFVRVEGGAS